MSPKHIALRITLVYIIFGVIWILFSDHIVRSFVDDVERLSEIQTYKGWFYVLLTGVLFFALSYASLKYQRNLTENDALTDLLNRNSFRQELEQLILQSRKRNHHCTLVLLNLDNFRQINNTAGQQVGDGVLIDVANTVRELFTRSSIIGRLAGDEFGIAIDSQADPDVLKQISDLQNRLLTIKVPGSPNLPISIRVGISSYPEDGHNLKTLLTASTLALEEAKQLGGGEIRIYNRSYGEEAQSRLEMLAELKSAVHNKELSLVYQPQFDTHSRRITGVEVLVRWHRENKTSVRPDVFIPLAEQTGLIRDITNFVCQQTIHELCQHELLGKNKPIPKVSINISAKDFEDKRGAERFFEQFAQLEGDWSLVQLEITETAVMENFEKALPLLHQIKDKGIRISIDDFGTGYSSLSVLRKLPVKELKIDRAFTQEVTDSESDLQLVKAIIAMAHSLQISTVAEGVETTEQALTLRELKCDDMQGFLMSPPLTIEQLVPFVKQYQTSQ